MLNTLLDAQTLKSLIIAFSSPISINQSISSSWIQKLQPINHMKIRGWSQKSPAARRPAHPATVASGPGPAGVSQNRSTQTVPSYWCIWVCMRAPTQRLLDRFVADPAAAWSGNHVLFLQTSSHPRKKAAFAEKTLVSTSAPIFRWKLVLSKDSRVQSGPH